MRRLIVILAAVLAGCAGPGGEPSDASPARRDYESIRTLAREDLLAWQAAGGYGDDPRPRWAGELEEFIRDHPDTPEAAEASLAALDLYAEARQVQGFFRAWELALRHAVDHPGLRGAFEKVATMRTVEAGGLGILISRDPAARARAWRQAAPRIVSDIERAMKATSSRETMAAGHDRIARTWHHMDLDPARALLHYRTIVDRYPDWSGAEGARMSVRQLEDLAPGREAPGFSAATLDGGALTLASLRGRVVLIVFWTSWSDDCADQIPHLKAARRRFGERGLEIVGVSLDEDPEAARRFVETHKISWPVVARGKGMLDPLAREYGVQAIPSIWLVGRDGSIVGRGLTGGEIGPAVAAAIVPPGGP